MTDKPETFEALLANWNTLQLSADLAIPYVNARKILERKSVSEDHWPRIIMLMATKGIVLTIEDMYRMKAARRAEKRQRQAA